MRTCSLILVRIELLVEIRASHQPARVDGVDRGVGAIGRPGQLAQLARQVRIGEHMAPVELIALFTPFFARLAEPAAEHRILAQARLRERIEVVAVADPHDRLAAIGDAFELPQDVVGRRKRHVRAIAHF